MSIVGPRYCMLIAEHSICQPGLPAPQGLFHDGSPGCADFQSAKSCAASLSYSSELTRAPARNARFLRFESLPYGLNFPIWKYTEPSSPRYAYPFFISDEISEIIARTCSVAFGYFSARLILSFTRSFRNASVYGRGMARSPVFRLRDCAMILSS